jgi:hypothetical protein
MKSIATSTVKSDHKAIIAYANFRKPNLIKQKTRRMFRKWSPNQHAMLLNHITKIVVIFDNRSDVQRNFDHLYATLTDLLNRFYPSEASQ